MSSLAGRVAIVTGAGQGLGRAHALELGARGARVIVNDLGADLSGQPEESAAEHVVAEIRAAGGSAEVSGHDVSDWAQAGELVALAVETYGDLHVLVNNAGILRDRTLANMSEEEWDAVVRVHLKGHAATTRHAVAHWRAEAKAERAADRSVVLTTSIAGLTGNRGQANYSAAKGALIAFMHVVALEAGRYGVRCNAISPSARTRMTAPDLADAAAADDPYAPAHVARVVAWLARSDCPATRQVLQVIGRRLLVVQTARIAAELEADGDWNDAVLDRELPRRLVRPLEVEDVLAEFMAAGSG